MRSFDVPLLLVGGGGYTIRNVARCWCYETGVALGIKLDDKMPSLEYYEYFGPDYTLHVAPSNMENKNSRDMLDEIRGKLLDYLSKLQHAPSVPFQERPPEAELPEDPNERWDQDSDMEVDDHPVSLQSRVKRENMEIEHKESENVKETDRPRDMEVSYGAGNATSKPSANMGLDQPNVSVKIEEENSNKRPDQVATMDP